ncbi:hypothetical protein GJAV_G00070210 [Gymnothorax javanicus]|nr:hypothetical protein GJAV_G00070210 [Gymnothorax javanicus]
MDRKHTNLGRPPPKLRYFKAFDRARPPQKANVVRNIEECFDELDSSSSPVSELSELSPLPKTVTQSEDAQVQSVVLLPVGDVCENGPCSEQSPSEGFLPQKTSSPVELLTENGDRREDERERGRGSPLLFPVEDEAPESDAIRIGLPVKVQSTRKDFDESTEKQRKAFSPFSSDEEFLSLQSKKLCVAPVVPSEKNQASDEAKGASSKDDKREPSTIPEKSKDPPHLEKHGDNIVPSEIKSPEAGRECSVFVQKLKDAGRSKSVGFRKGKSPVPVSPPSEADEEFMIVEDENLKNQRWFSIPRRTESKRNKPPQEGETEATQNNREGKTVEVTAKEKQRPPQKSRNKLGGGKGTKSKKNDALTNVNERTEGDGVEGGVGDIPAPVQSNPATQSCVEDQEKVVGHTETLTADLQVEDVVPQVPSTSSGEPDERAVKKNKATNKKPRDRRPGEKLLSRKKPVSQMGEVEAPSSPVADDDVAPDGQTFSKRKRRKPSCYWLINGEEETDVRSREIHGEVPDKKRKPSKAVKSPETVTSPKQATGQDIDAPVYEAGKKARVAKQKLPNGRHGRQSKKRLTEASVPPVQCEMGVENGGDGDRGSADPAPSTVERPAPSPVKRRKKPEEKPRSRQPKIPVNQENDCVDRSEALSRNAAQQESHKTGRRTRRKPGSWWLVTQEEHSGNESPMEISGRHKQCKKPDQLRQSSPKSHTSGAQGPSLETVFHNQREVEEPQDLIENSSPQHHLKKKVKNRTANVLPKSRRAPKSSPKPVEKGADKLNSAKAREKSLQSFMRKNSLLAPRNVRTSLASFGSLFTPVSSKTTSNARNGPSRKTVGSPIAEFPSPREHSVSSSHGRHSVEYCQDADDYHISDQNANSVSQNPRAGSGPNYSSSKSSFIANTRKSGPRNLELDDGRMNRSEQLQSEVDVCKGFKSGPSSMIEVYEKKINSLSGMARTFVSDTDAAHALPSIWKDPKVLSEFQMCGPPLRPMTLLAEDREDLEKWLKNVWSSPDGTDITPEHFQWFAYRGRAMGYRTDLLYESFSNGKILLGSYMNKPLQVDNSAIYVFNILTSTICVTINGAQSSLSCGQTFMVPCGHPYGLQNLSAEPAVLLFHRMVAEDPDSGEEGRRF